MTGCRPASEPLFAYGTLQLESVQIATLGRTAVGRPDTLPGYRLVPLYIDDPDVVAVSGKSEHTMAVRTDRNEDCISGTVLLLTREELDRTDGYEVAAVSRVKVTLGSGARAWAYVDAGSGPAEP
jgi:hypothetical protein